MERHQNYRENNIIIYYIIVYSSLPSQIWILQHDNPFFPWGTNLIISQSFVFTADICCEDGAAEMTAGSRGGKKTTTPSTPNSKRFGWNQSFASPLLTPLNYSLRAEDKQSLLATIVLLISPSNITDNKKRAEGEAQTPPSPFFSLFYLQINQ